MKKPHKHWKDMAQYAQDAADIDKPWERWQTKDMTGIWIDAMAPLGFYAEVEYRRKPWTLGRSVNGFTLGDGQEWHRNDFTEDMLPEGTRPLILGEREERSDEWRDYVGGWHSNPCENHSTVVDSHRRTRRPLPPVIDPYAELKAAFNAGKTIQLQWSINLGTDKWEDNPVPDWSMPAKQYRIKPAPKLVPLGPEDVKCGDEIRAIGHTFRRAIVFVDEFKVGLFNASYSFQDLKSSYEINRHDGRGFVRCEKEEE